MVDKMWNEPDENHDGKVCQYSKSFSEEVHLKVYVKLVSFIRFSVKGVQARVPRPLGQVAQANRRYLAQTRGVLAGEEVHVVADAVLSALIEC